MSRDGPTEGACQKRLEEWRGGPRSCARSRLNHLSPRLSPTSHDTTLLAATVRYGVRVASISQVAEKVSDAVDCGRELSIHRSRVQVPSSPPISTRSYEARLPAALSFFRRFVQNLSEWPSLFSGNSLGLGFHGGNPIYRLSAKSRDDGAASTREHAAVADIRVSTPATHSPCHSAARERAAARGAGARQPLVWRQHASVLSSTCRSPVDIAHRAVDSRTPYATAT
jgi:hypothetical protein